MSWIQKEMPVVPGYESAGDSVQAKRWLNFKLSQLLDTGDPLWEYRSVLKTKEDICNFVIAEFDYPMVRGRPTDKHYNNWFDSNCCHQITQDYWQMASETLRTLRLNTRVGKKGFGDCEDVAALFTTLFFIKKWQSWMCIGAVLQDGNLLGYHGWSIFEEINGIWRLYEATLSIPPIYPEGYPQINPDDTGWKVGDITYQAFAKFNRKEYYEPVEGNLMKNHLQVGLKSKETRRKHEAIAKAWGIPTKPLRKLSFLSRLRWRK